MLVSEARNLGSWGGSKGFYKGVYRGFAPSRKPTNSKLRAPETINPEL